MTSNVTIASENQVLAGKCCWHCNYFIRQQDALMIDGPLGNVCIIDRDRTHYPIKGYLSVGDVEREPQYVCDRFDFDVPPK